MAEQILLVEDDPQISEIIMDYFTEKEEKFIMEHASDGTEAVRMTGETDYDLILLDIMLPGMNGFSVIREIRRTKDVPVIMITARTREEDRLLGYELGCDDYVCKPFSVAELYAKANALIRRSKGTVVRSEIICGDISLQKETLEVRVSGKIIELPPKELDLLVALMSRKNWVFSRDMLLDQVWGMDYDGTDRTVDNHIKKLRKYLGPAGEQIKTLYKKGYKITD